MRPKRKFLNISLLISKNPKPNNKMNRLWLDLVICIRSRRKLSRAIHSNLILSQGGSLERKSLAPFLQHLPIPIWTISSPSTLIQTLSFIWDTDQQTPSKSIKIFMETVKSTLSTSFISVKPNSSSDSFAGIILTSNSTQRESKEC